MIGCAADPVAIAVKMGAVAWLASVNWGDAGRACRGAVVESPSRSFRSRGADLPLWRWRTCVADGGRLLRLSIGAIKVLDGEEGKHANDHPDRDRRCPRAQVAQSALQHELLAESHVLASARTVRVYRRIVTVRPVKLSF